MSGFLHSYREFQGLLVDLAGTGAKTGRQKPISPAPFESLVAALVESQAGATRVGPWLLALRGLDITSPEALAACDLAEFEAALGMAGSPRARAQLAVLKRLAAEIVEAGGLEAIELAPDEQLRERWRAVPGLGPATVDRLIRAVGRAAYPVDRASYRIVVRHGWLDESADYDEARATLEAAAFNDPTALAIMSAGFERIGTRWCKPSKPVCRGCPLAPWLPEGGPHGDFIDE